MSKEKNNVENVIESAMRNLDFSVEKQKTVGEVIVNERGQRVIPVFNMTVGVMCGGGEYGSLKISKDLGERFAGGNVTLCNMKPDCFIIDNGKGFSVVNHNDALDGILKLISKITEKF